MPKWSKDATEFIVSVNYSEKRGYQVRIPKPIIEELRKTPNREMQISNIRKLKFLIKSSKIEIQKA